MTNQTMTIKTAQEKKATILKLLEELRDGLRDAPHEALQQATTKNQNAVRRYEDESKDAAGSAVDKAAELQKEKRLLEEEAAKKAAALEKLAGNEKEYSKLDDELTTLYGKISKLERRAAALTDGTLTDHHGSDEAYQAVSDTYEDLLRAIDTDSDATTEYLGILGEIADLITKDRGPAELRAQRKSVPDAIARKRVSIEEQHNGPIDVTGHHAGSDDDAKLRFMKGNIRGIENTPAGRALLKQKGGKA